MIIEKIKSPEDLKTLEAGDLKSLAEELRNLIIERVSINGGHLSSNLGVIELTIALHYVFDSPTDKIIWDVGHQSYSHKLLTGRYERFPTLRKYKGLSGFPRIDESPFDAFGTGHSSTSISAATGMIEARDIIKKSHISNLKSQVSNKVIAVIGDGAMTSGLAFEGLNHAGQLKKDLIVILNDNEMSISRNVGALSSYLNRILTGDIYQRFKREIKSFLENLPMLGSPMSKMARKAEETLKGLFLPGVLFEELGFNYIGPIDGHNIELLIETFRKVKTANEPILIHLITKKGRGYRFSEEDPCIFHGVGPFDPDSGVITSDTAVPTYSEVFGRTLTELAQRDSRIVAVSAAMREGTGLDIFADAYPDKFYDVGIAEPHAVTFAAGLASQGLRPVVAIYSTFLQRAYDEIVHDVCIQNLPVVFAIDRAGVVGEDGATHQGLFDISYLRHIPNLVFMAPKDGTELKMMLEIALRHSGPCAIRYPRGKVPVWDVNSITPSMQFGIGESEMLMDGYDIALIAIGNTVYPAIRAAERLKSDGLSPLVVNARFIKPIDGRLLSVIASRVMRILTIEENVIAGGFGSAVLEYLSRTDIAGYRVKILGIPDEFVEHGAQGILRKKYQLDADGIYNTALSFMREAVCL
ncbi:MAG: 1-deoxy-D-xylulose-5-phosphate synthase [Thermodesulfovibrionales bacterium]